MDAMIEAIRLKASSNTGAAFEMEAARTKPLVLVADDDLALQVLARASLEQEGFAVEEATDGAAALESFSRSQPDIVLLDINMPKADGFTVCSRIRQLPGGPKTPVIMMTGAADVEAIRTAYNVGATDFITKPLHWVLLGYRVRYMLRASRIREDLAVSEALYERAQHERHRVEALYDLTRSLASASDGEGVLRLAVEEVSRLLALDVAALRLVDGDDLVLRAATGAWTSARRRLKVGESFSGRVIAVNAPVVIEDVLADPRFDAMHRRFAEELGLSAFVGVPIKQAVGTPLGVLFGYSRQRRVFSTDEVSLLSAFADQISLSLEKERLAAAARQSEKLATMGQLLAGVAHELNNPLSVIVGYAGIVRSRLTDPSLEGAVGQIETAGTRCARIVRNFLALARKHPPERASLMLNELVTESVELLAYALRVDNVDVRLDLAADLPRLWADRHQLQQVLINLVTNAHHAMREAATRRLSIVTRHDVERARVVLRVADSGPGVPAALRDRIFEPFFTTKPPGQGTGLGLSLCYGIVEAHGGTLSLEDSEDRGAVFCIDLPTEMPSDVRPEGQRPTVPVLCGAKTVLVVDDEPSVSEVLAEMLSADGYRVETAATGAAALEKLASQTYDLVVTDIRMPGIDGPTLYRDAARVNRGTEPAFVFMTGDLLAGQTATFLATTGAPCLRKPFVLDDVRRVMAEARSSAVGAVHRES